MKNVADKSVDTLYGDIRSRYDDARANGYRLNAYFLREQEIIVSALIEDPGIVLDIACGSGLMSLPLKDRAELLIGLDFNEYACAAAKLNTLEIIRGDAFSLPFQNQSINNACCCQFLNQQSHESMKVLLSESYRVLASGGKMLIIWRNGKSIIHRVAYEIFKIYDKFAGQPSFPVMNHSMQEVESYAHKIGFEIVSKQAIFPLLRWRTDKVNGVMSKLIGASYFLVLQRP